MDNEFSPNPGPGLWIGAGVLMLFGGGSALVVAATASDWGALLVLGAVAGLAGLCLSVIGLRGLLME